MLSLGVTKNLFQYFVIIRLIGFSYRNGPTYIEQALTIFIVIKRHTKREIKTNHAIATVKVLK